MKKIVVINASPRVNMNTGILVREAAKGAQPEGHEGDILVTLVDIPVTYGDIDS